MIDKVGSCKIIQEDAICRNLFYEALQYHLLVDRRSEMMVNNVRLKPRSCLGKQIDSIQFNPSFLVDTELSEVLVFLGGEDERVVVRGVEVYNPERY